MAWGSRERIKDLRTVQKTCEGSGEVIIMPVNEACFKD